MGAERDVCRKRSVPSQSAKPCSADGSRFLIVALSLPNSSHPVVAAVTWGPAGAWVLAGSGGPAWGRPSSPGHSVTLADWLEPRVCR